MKKDPYPKSLFKLGLKSLNGNANDDIVARLHDELLLKVFHTKIANDVKDYKDSKSKKMLTKESSNVSFCTTLKCASESTKSKPRKEKEKQKQNKLDNQSSVNLRLKQREMR
jgi:hypothetical protein